jgi:hypothetical protein
MPGVRARRLDYMGEMLRGPGLLIYSHGHPIKRKHRIVGADLRSASTPALCSIVVIQRELMWMRTQPDRIELSFALPSRPRLDEILGEHAAPREELVVLF